MSNATVIQLYDRVFIGSDSAMSTKFVDKIYRIGEGGKKLFVVDDKVIFCSGNMVLSYLVMEYYHVNEDKSINSLAMIAKELFRIYGRTEFSLEIMVCTIQDGKSIVYIISPYNDFEIVKQELNHPDQYAIWTGGIKTKESFGITHQMLLSGFPIRNIYRQVFSQISFEGVGGTLTAYSLSSQGILKIIEEQIVENKYERLDVNELIQANLIVGEYVHGTLGSFAKVTASSIIVGSDNQKLPDNVIESSSNWNGMYDKAVGYIDGINGKIRNDLRITAPLPTSISLNDKGITATTSDPTKFARLDYRGLYIQNGALQITSLDGTTIIDGSGVNASKINTGSLNGIYMTIGTGNSVFKADANGIYLGSSVFASAPFRVDMSGNVTANNITLSGTINSSTMNNSNIVGGTLTIGSGNSIFKADSNGIYLGSSYFGSAPFHVSQQGNLRANNATLSNANISGNITMTGGSISWSNVTKPSYTATEVGALATNSPKLTNITSTGIYTGTISANQINAGRINAQFIDTENLTVARIAQKGSPNNYAVLGGSFGDLELYYNGTNYFTIYNDIDAVTLRHRGKNHIRFSSSTGNSAPLGNWDFSGANVSGLNVVAVFG